MHPCGIPHAPPARSADTANAGDRTHDRLSWPPMSAGGINSKLSRGLAIVSALLMVATALLWADSYRNEAVNISTPKKPDTQPANNPDMRLAMFVFFLEPITTSQGIGPSLSLEVGSQQWFTALARKGRLRLSFAWCSEYETPISRLDASWGDFSFGQLMYETGLRAEPPNNLCLGVREVAMPLWSLFLLFAIHPVCHIVRGPLRRRRRQKRGQCIACGYDVSQSPDRCPECGTAREPALSPTAGDR